MILGKSNMHELGQRDHDRQLDWRTDVQSVRPRSRARRIEWRQRRRGRGELRGDRVGLRHLRIDSHSVGRAQSVRPAAHQGVVEHSRDRSAVAHAGRRRSARSHGHAISRSVSTRRSVPTPPTRRRAFSTDARFRVRRRARLHRAARSATRRAHRAFRHRGGRRRGHTGRARCIGEAQSARGRGDRRRRFPSSTA